MYSWTGISPETFSWTKDEFSEAFSSKVPAETACVMLNGFELLLAKPDTVRTLDGIRHYFVNTVSGLLCDPNYNVNCVALVFPRNISQRVGDPVDVLQTANATRGLPTRMDPRTDSGLDPQMDNGFGERHRFSVTGDTDLFLTREEWVDLVMTPSVYMYELLPVIAHALVDQQRHTIPMGKWILTWGLPMERDPDMPCEGMHAQGTRCEYIRPTNCLSARAARASMFNRVGVIETSPMLINPQTGRRWYAYDLHKWDAEIDDPLMVFLHLYRFIGKTHTVLVRTSNTEFLPIALLFARDHVFSRGLYVGFPRPSNSRGIVVVNVPHLSELIQTDEVVFGHAVQNRLLSFAFLCALDGCTVFTPETLSRERLSFRSTFHQNADTFSHLIQLSLALPKSSSELRFPVLDEACFSRLVQLAISSAPAKTPLGKDSVETARQLFSPDGDVSHSPEFPTSETMRRAARLLVFVIQYWLNGHRNAAAFWKNGPFWIARPGYRTSLPYYGYCITQKGEGSSTSQLLSIADNCATQEDPVDLCYLRHFLDRKVETKRPRAPKPVAQPTVAPKSKKRKVEYCFQMIKGDIFSLYLPSSTGM